MKDAKMFCFAVVLSAGLFALWGCPKKAEVSAVPEARQVEPAPASQAETKPEGKEAVGAEEAVNETGAVKEASAAGNGGLQSIHFDFDKWHIGNDAKPVLKANAEWLKANPKVKIRIEGNCDERGTAEYNQALGQRRAASAKKYLNDLGISAGRISLISYGKEKPLCTDGAEGCWQKNRRDDFVVAAE
jgi:peptidoglycan-associated lipoprotein